MRFRRINNPPHLPHLLLTQLHLPTSPILHQPLPLRRPRNRNQALSRHPRERNLYICQLTTPKTFSFKAIYLRRRAPFPARQLLHLLHNRLVPVEVLALELGHRAPEIVGRKVVGRGVVEVVDEPAVAEGRVGDVCDAEGGGGRDEAVGFV